MAKRPLTPAEVVAAERLAKAVEESGKSQDAIAAEVGVSQGMVWQWANGRLAVSVAKAGALAKAVGLDDPSEISPLWLAAAERMLRDLGVLPRNILITSLRALPEEDRGQVIADAFSRNDEGSR